MLLSYEKLNDIKQDLSASIDNLNTYDRNVDEFSNQVKILRKQLKSFSPATTAAAFDNKQLASAEQPNRSSDQGQGVSKNHAPDFIPPLPTSKPPKMSVHFLDDDDHTEQIDPIVKDGNRCSYEIEEINYPSRNHKCREVTPALIGEKMHSLSSSDSSSETAESSEDESPEPIFRPIAISRSNENLTRHSFSLVRPVPLFASKSIQDLRMDRYDKQSAMDPLFHSKSSDDLLLPDIDGMTKTTNLSKFKKFRYNRSSSTSLSNLSLKADDSESIYANLFELGLTTPEKLANTVSKKPKPLPRMNSIDELNIAFDDDKASKTKTVVYVIDKSTNEFVRADEPVQSNAAEEQLNKVTPKPRKYPENVNLYDDAKLDQLKRTSFVLNKPNTHHTNNDNNGGNWTNRTKPSSKFSLLPVIRFGICLLFLFLLVCLASLFLYLFWQHF